MRPAGSRAPQVPPEALFRVTSAASCRTEALRHTSCCPRFALTLCLLDLLPAVHLSLQAGRPDSVTGLLALMCQLTFCAPWHAPKRHSAPRAGAHLSVAPPHQPPAARSRGDAHGQQRPERGRSPHRHGCGGGARLARPCSAQRRVRDAVCNWCGLHAREPLGGTHLTAARARKQGEARRRAASTPVICGDLRGVFHADRSIVSFDGAQQSPPLPGPAVCMRRNTNHCVHCICLWLCLLPLYTVTPPAARPVLCSSSPSKCVPTEFQHGGVSRQGLKLSLKHQRPAHARKADPGMPSSHANSLAFLATSAALALQRPPGAQAGQSALLAALPLLPAAFLVNPSRRISSFTCSAGVQHDFESCLCLHACRQLLGGLCPASRMLCMAE